MGKHTTNGLPVVVNLGEICLCASLLFSVLSKISTVSRITLIIIKRLKTFHKIIWYTIDFPSENQFSLSLKSEQGRLNNYTRVNEWIALLSLLWIVSHLLLLLPGYLCLCLFSLVVREAPGRQKSRVSIYSQSARALRPGGLPVIFLMNGHLIHFNDWGISYT